MTARAGLIPAKIRALEEAAEAVDREKTVALLKKLVPTYDPEAAAAVALGS
jgi:hypothetical protein